MSYTREWSGRRDSNSRHPPWQGGTLPLSYYRMPIALVCEGNSGEITKCGRRDLNSYALRHQILSLARLPFRHARRLEGLKSKREIYYKGRTTLCQTVLCLWNQKQKPNKNRRNAPSGLAAIQCARVVIHRFGEDRVGHTTPLTPNALG